MTAALAGPRPPSAFRLAVCALFVFAPIGVQMPFFPLWLNFRGFTPDVIALLLGVSPIIRFLANMAVPPWADRTGDIAGVLLLCALVTTLAQAASGLPFGIAWIFALSLVATAGQGPMVPLLDSIVLRESRRRVEAGETPLDYGSIRGAGSVAVLFVMLLSGLVAQAAPPAAIIWMIAGASAAAFLAVALTLPRRPLARNGNGSLLRGKIDDLPLIALVIAASSAIQASHAVLYAFGSIGWREAGYSDAAIGRLWACGVATEVGLFLFADRLARGRSIAYLCLILGGAVAVLRWGFMAFDPGPALLTVLQMLHAGSFAATYLGAVVAVAALSTEGRRAQIQGWVSGANALLLAAATVASGPLWTMFGMRAYLAAAALAAAGFVCAALAAGLSGNLQPQSAGSGGKTTEPS